MRGSVLSSALSSLTVTRSSGAAARAAGAPKSAASSVQARTRRRRGIASLQVPAWRRRRTLLLERALRLSTPADVLDHVVEVVADGEALHVALVDHPLGQRAVAQPVDQAAPIGRVDQADRELVDLAGLDQRQRLEQLVERAEPAGQH